MQKLLELVIALEKFTVDRFRCAVRIGNIAVARDRRDPFPIRADTAADRDCLVSVNPGRCLPVHFRLGCDRHLLFPDCIPTRESIANHARPRFRLPGRFRREIPFIRQKMNIPIAAEIGLIRHLQFGITGNFRQRILQIRDGNDRCTQQIAVRPDGDIAGLGLRIPPARDENITLGRLGRRTECRRRMIVVRHIVRRAGRPDKTDDIHRGLTRNIGIISRPDGNRAAPIRGIVCLGVRAGVVFLFPRRIRRFCVSRIKGSAIRNKRARIGRGCGLVFNAGHGHGKRTAVEIVIFFGCDSARCFDGDGFFIVQGHALLLLFLCQCRIRPNADLPQLHLRIVRDFTHGIDTGAPRQGSADAERCPIVFRISFRFVARGHRRFIRRGNHSPIIHGDMGIRHDGKPQIAARAGCQPRAHRIHAEIFAVFVIGENRDGFPVKLRTLSDIDARLLIQRHLRQRDRAGHDTARTRNSARIRIFKIRILRFLHRGLQRQGALRIETRAVSHFHERFVLGHGLCDGDSDCTATDTDRRRRRFQNRRVLCRDGNRASQKRRIAVNFRLGRHLRRQRNTRPRTAEKARARSHGTRHQFRIRF